MATNKRNAKGNGSIRRRSDGRWEGRYTVTRDGNGKQISRSVYGKTKEEVRKKLASVTVELDEGSYLEPTKYTLESWCSE